MHLWQPICSGIHVSLASIHVQLQTLSETDVTSVAHRKPCIIAGCAQLPLHCMCADAQSRHGSTQNLARPPSFGSIPSTPGEKTPKGPPRPSRITKLESMASTAVRAATKIQVGLWGPCVHCAGLWCAAGCKGSGPCVIWGLAAGWSVPAPVTGQQECAAGHAGWHCRAGGSAAVISTWRKALLQQAGPYTVPLQHTLRTNFTS